MTRILFGLAAAAIAGCASLDPYDGLSSRHLATYAGGQCETDDGSEDCRLTESQKFEKLIDLVGKDARNLHSRAAEWNHAEGAFGLAVLAAAAYGGFNSVYSGDNLKDAAFAAAALGSLRSFATPGARRDAYLATAARMTCLYEKAAIFAGPPPLASNAAILAAPQSVAEKARSVGGQSPLFSALGDLAARSATDAADNVFAPKVAYSGVAAQSLLDAALINQRNADSAHNALIGAFSALQNEHEVYKERFTLVSSVYLAIIGKLFDSTKFTTPEYDSSVEALKKAAAKAAESEANADQAAAVAAAGRAAPVAAFAAFEQELKKYAQAKVDVIACKPAD
jgi:hypothetical protein